MGNSTRMALTPLPSNRLGSSLCALRCCSSLSTDHSCPPLHFTPLFTQIATPSLFA